MQIYQKIQTYANFKVKKYKKVLKKCKKQGVNTFFGANSYIIPKNFVVHVPMAEEEWLANADKVKDIVEHYRLVSRKPVYELRTKN